MIKMQILLYEKGKLSKEKTFWLYKEEEASISGKC